MERSNRGRRCRCSPPNCSGHLHDFSRAIRRGTRWPLSLQHDRWRRPELSDYACPELEASSTLGTEVFNPNGTELIAERLTRFASCVGRENLIAGTDCGFAQEEINRRVHPSIMWAKLEAMAEGARLASRA